MRGPAYILVGLLRSWRAVELGLVALLHQRAARQACTLTIQGVSKKLPFVKIGRGKYYR